MNWLKKASLVALASFLLIGGIATLAYPQGAVTLVQLVLGGTVVSGSNPLPVTGSFSASLGGFTPSTSGARGTPISVTTADSSGTLPTGTVVVVSDVGSNPMYCNVNGVAATTSDELIPASSWFAFTIPSGQTVLHCIATGGSTTANMVGGSGLPTGAGGGSSSGGGGGAVFGPTANGSAAANPPILLGGTANGTGTGTVENVKVTSAGVVSTDVTTVNGITTLTGAGATGTGAQRVGVAQDTTTIAGSAPGTAGTPSTNVVSVQGVASGTNLPVSQATAGNLNATVVGTGTFATQSTVTQATASNLNATVVGTGTFATQSVVTQGTAANLNATVVQTTAANLNATVAPSSASTWGIGTSTQNSATVSNGQLALAQFNTTPTTITTGNMSPLQLDNAGNLLVNIKAGAGSGGTALADEGTFTPGTTNFTPSGCLFNTGTITLTSGQAGALSCTSARSLHTTVDNTNANGSATSANSSPVVIASDQAAVAVKAASGAFASGSIASGALASGSIASGAMVDLLTVIGTKAAGTAATNSLLAGGVYNTSLPAPTNGQQAAIQLDNQGRQIVAPPSILSSTLVKGTTAAMTGTTSTQVVAAVTSQRVYVMSMHCTNSSATATLVSIQDGSAGTTLDTLICPAGGGETRSGGGFPIVWTTAGNGLYAAVVTTGASVIVTASGFSSAN